MTITIYVDVQHSGKPDKPRDRGATGNGWDEVGATRLIANGIEHACVTYADVHCIILSDGRYSSRHKRVNDYHNRIGGKAVYLALHLNALDSKPHKGVIFFHYQSKKGPALAQAVADAIKPAVGPTIPTPCESGDWTRNAYATIRGVREPIALCLEPFYIDSPAAKEWLFAEALEALGVEIAAAVIEHMKAT